MMSNEILGMQRKQVMQCLGCKENRSDKRKI